MKKRTGPRPSRPGGAKGTGGPRRESREATGRGAAPVRGGGPRTAERPERRPEREDRAPRERELRGRERDREREGDFGGNPNEQVEGRHPVLEALKAGREINKIMVAEGSSGSSLMEILAVASKKNLIVQNVPKSKLDQIAPGRNHQGVIAYIAAKEYAELDEIIANAKNSPRPGLIIVLDEVEDPHNLGSILRSADAVGAHGIVIPKRRAVPLTSTVAKASAGAIEHIPVARVANISQTIEALKKEGFWVVGTEVDTEKLYHQVDMTGPTVVVIGNEGKGLGEVVKKRCDYLVRLPMVGNIQSLNAGVATGILLYEVLRQRGEKR